MSNNNMMPRKLFVLLCLHFCIFWNISAQSPPSMIKQPPTDTLLFQVAVGQEERVRPFIIECEANGEPAPTYEWWKNGRIFEYQAYDDRVSQQRGTGTLVFTRPSDVDEGYYQCFARNQYGTSVSNGVFVRKSDLSEFSDDRPQTKVVNEGDPLTITCSPPTGFPKPKIFWIIQSVSGALRSINNSRITVDPEGALHFSNVTKEDSLDHSSYNTLRYYYYAYYSCAASSVFRNEYKLGNRIRLQVNTSANSLSQSKHAPKVQYRSPPIIVAVRNTPQEIHCIFGGTPLPEIRWRKNGTDLPLNRVTLLNYGKTLKIKKVDFEDEGTYECTASNGVGNDQSHAVKITIQSAPYWLSAPNNTNATEGEDVMFECKATGVPEPEIKWLVNGIPIENAKVRNARRKVLNPNTILIERLEKTDTAVYQCNASNSNGHAFRNFYLNVLALTPDITEPPAPLYETVKGHRVVLTPPGKPGPVASFDAFPMGHNALSLVWKKPKEPNGKITGYQLYYQKVEGLDVHGEDITRAKLAGLEPGTKYRVTIHALSDQGEGVPEFIEMSTDNEEDQRKDKRAVP